MNGTIAAIVAKTEATRSLHPKLYGALVLLGGLLLLASAFPSKAEAARPHGES